MTDTIDAASAENPTEVRVVDFLAEPPAAVWRALTTPELLAEWLMPNDFAPVVGHRFHFSTEPIPPTRFSGVIACEVLELREPELLVISWADDSEENDMATTVTFRLEAHDGGTRLTVVQAGYRAGHSGDQMARRIMGGGWGGRIVPRLKEVLGREVLGREAR
ncbi:SRPBCC domain-containing protein [Sinomonas sp. ASV486]|uniref:SRPBCC family protein n=1 Tax=Sinomonas sp. ASV486 TaxID=3051170 RepID=UPI0027DDC1A3|nr:SRPBCC domain-containing protein [Sinomonas sp. ASV486]MDQ4489117.1 SRPBCC domain-containing protein [Sinomonas sp. ASV486]